MISEKIASGFPHKSGVSSWHQRSLGVGIESGFLTWLSSAVIPCVGSGVVGSGSASGVFVVPPNFGLVEAGLRSGGLGGVLLSDLTVALTLGISGTYSLSGVSVGVGVGSFGGSGVGLGLSELLSASIKGGLVSSGVVGFSDIGYGVSNGIFNLMRSGIVQGGVITGSALGSSPSTSMLSLKLGV
jgi:hypothetical protein